MPAQPKVCVFSGSTENLNTSMVITLPEGNKITVWISDEWIESATPKSDRDAFIKNQAKYESDIKLMHQLADKYGFIVSPKATPPSPVKPEPDVEAEQTQPAQGITPTANKNIVVNQPKATQLDHAAAQRIMDAKRPKTASTSTIPTPAVAEVKLDDPNLKRAISEETTELGVTAGRAGVETVIPRTQTGPLGTTVIQIVRTTDKDIQDRTKARNSSTSDQEPGATKYSTRTITCPMCRNHDQARPKCKKCNGMGIIDIET